MLRATFFENFERPSGRIEHIEVGIGSLSQV